MGKNLVKITFAGDDKSLGKTLDGVSTSASKTGGALGGKLKTGAMIASGALLGGLALAARAGFAEFVEGQKITAQTEATLKSTGGAANVTTGQIKDLAGSIGAMSGIDAEAIQSGQNLLLTFTKIRNEAGAGNAVFDRTTRAVVDMSVAMGTDAKTAAMQVGKALNDPIKGVGALGKAGVQFTKQQKDQIKAMVESGDVMGAQKMILGELETQFGGSAEAAGKTFAGQMNRLRNAFEDLAGQIIAGLMPALTVMLGVVSKVVGFMQRHQTTTKVLVGVLAGLATTVLAVSVATKAYGAIANTVKAITAAWTAVTKIQILWTKAAAAAQKALNIVMRMNPIGLVVTALVLLVGAVILAYKKSETFRDVVDAAFGVVKGVAETLKTVVVGVFEAITGAAETVAKWVTTHFGKIADFFVTWGPLLLGPIGLVIMEWDRLVAAGKAVWEGIKAGWEAIAGVPAAIVAFIRTGVTNALEGLAAAGKVVAFAVWDAIKAAWVAIGGVGDAIGGFIRDGVTGALEALAQAGRVAAGKVWDGIKAGWDAIDGVADRVTSFIRDGITGALSAIAETAQRIGGKIWAGIKTSLSNLGSNLWSLISSAVDAALRRLPGPVRRFFGLGGGGPASPQERRAAAAVTARGSHGGSIVPGRTGQEVPMTLLAGQRVLPPGQRSAEGGGGGGSYSITVHALDPRTAAAAVVEAIRVYERTSGQQFVRV